MNGLLFALLITNGVFKMDRKTAKFYLESASFSIPADVLPAHLQQASIPAIKEWLTEMAYPVEAVNGK